MNEELHDLEEEYKLSDYQLYKIPCEDPYIIIIKKAWNSKA